MFSDGEESTSTETELDNDDARPGEESWDVEPLGYVNPMQILESHLMYLLKDHLNLAAHLIPEIHWRVHFEPPEDVEGYNSAQSHEQGTNKSTQEPSATPSNGSTTANPSSRPLKRARSLEGNEEDNRDGAKRPRPNPGPVSRYFASGRSGRQPTFACHFHKFDPRKYGPLTDRGFRTCAGPGPLELRRIKYFYPWSKDMASRTDILEEIISGTPTNAFDALDVTPSSTASMNFAHTKVQKSALWTLRPLRKALMMNSGLT